MKEKDKKSLEEKYDDCYCDYLGKKTPEEILEYIKKHEKEKNKKETKCYTTQGKNQKT